jgi:hypothetical protein
MPLQNINIGNQVNDGLGDDLRAAFQKVNANFTALSQEILTTASNLGTSGVGIFNRKNGANLEFKRLIAGRNITLDDQANAVIIDNNAPFALTRIDTDSGSLIANESNFGHFTLQGGPDVDVTTFGTSITVNTVLPVTKILTTFDFGPLAGNFLNTEQLSLAFTNVDFGSFTQPSYVSLDCGRIVA